MAAPIRFLSGRQQQQKIGIEGNTQNEKVLEVVGQVGIGTTIFSTDVELEVRGDVKVSGVVTAGSIDITGTGGSISATSVTVGTGGLDVDGQTDLDELVVAGVTTFSALADVNNRLDVVGGANIDQVNVTGIASFKQLDVSTGGLDVDGQTDLDELVVAGVSTYNALVDIDNRLDVTGGANLDQLNVTGVSTFGSAVDVNAGLDVDGQADLDEVVVAGVATFSSLVDVNARLDVVGGANIDQVNTGVLTATSLNVTNKLTTTGIGISIANGTGNTAYIEGPEEIWIDPHPVGVATTSGIVRIRGDLYVDGTNFIVDSERIELGDFRVGIATTISTNALLDGAGLGIGSESIEKTITWNNATSALMSSENWNLASGKHYEIAGTDVLSSTTLGSGVVNSSLTSVGTLGQLNVTGVTTSSGGFDGNLTGTIQTAAQTNITSLGTLSSLVVSGITSSSAFADFDYLQAPFGSTISFTVTVGSKDATHRYNGTGSGQAYLINGIQSPFLTLTPGRTYRFLHDNTGSHPLRFYLEADKTTQYDTNVDFQDTYTEITVTDQTPTVLHYQCSAHPYMGNAVQTNSNILNTNYEATIRNGLNVTGVSTFASAIDINAGLDVDGQADLDEVVVAGVATFSNDVFVGTGITIHADNIHSSGIITALKFVGDGSQITNLPGFNPEGTSSLNDVNVSGTTTTIQLRVSGIGTAEKFVVSTGGLDVDGQTDLDELVVAGVSTFNALIDANNRIDVVGGANIDQVNVTGIASFAQLDVSTGGIDVDGQADLDEVVVAGLSTFNSLIDANAGVNIAAGLIVDQINSAGVATIGGDVSIADKIVHTGDTNTAIRFPTADTFTVETNGSERLRITSGGNINFLGNLVNVNATGVSSFVQLDVSTGGLDVDGETQLDELVVAGVSTFTSAVDINAGLDVDGQADLDEVVVAGAATFSGTVNFNSGFSVGSGTPLFASGFNVTDTATFSAPVDINAGLDVDGQADLDELVVAGVSTFTAKAVFNTAYPSIDADNEIQVGTAIQLGKAGVVTATTFSGALSGTATNATHVTVTDNESTDEENLIAFVENAQSGTGNHGLEMDGNLTYNPSSGTLSATAFSGDGSNLTGIGTQGPDGAFRGITVAGISTFNDDVRITAGGLNVTGVVTATSFSGSGASLTGVNAATLDSVDSTSFLRSDDADVKTSGNLTFNDDIKLTFGNLGADMQIHSDGTNSLIRDTTGNLKVTTRILGVSGIVTASGINVVAGSGEAGGNTGVVTAVAFHGDGSALTGIAATDHVSTFDLVVAGISTFNDDVKFTSATSGLGVFYDRSADTLKLLEDGSDNTKLTIGDNSSYSSYMQIYHDGGNSGIGYINYAGSNKMILSGNNITFMNKTRSENMLTAAQDGAVSLYHNNLTRLATTAEGIDVTGRTETDLLNVTGIASFTQIDVSTGGLDVDGQTDLDELQVAGVSTFSAKAVFNTAYPSIDADNEIQVGTAIQLGKAGVVTATSFVGDGSNLTGISAGGSPEFYTGITSSRQIAPLSFETSVFTFPSTSGKQYVIESINVANVDASVGVGTTVNIIASIQDATAAEQTYIAYNVPIVTGGTIELLKNPIVAGPSDVIRMWTTNTAYVGANNAAEVYMNFTEYSDSTDFISKFASTVSVASTSATTLYTSTSNPTMIEKIGFANRTDSGDFPISVKITNGASVTYLVKNLIVPRYSTVDILDRHKRIETGATIDVEVGSTSTIDIIIAGKKITS